MNNSIYEEQYRFIGTNVAWINSAKDISHPDMASKEIVYGLVDDERCLVFVPRWNAFACLHFLEAIHLAGTCES